MKSRSKSRKIRGYNEHVPSRDDHRLSYHKIKLSIPIIVCFVSFILYSYEVSRQLKTASSEVQTITIEKANVSKADTATKSRRKKFFAIHIGPSKTGTSTIQEETVKEELFKTLLNKDGVGYLGKFLKISSNDWRRKDSNIFEKALACTTDNLNLTQGYEEESTETTIIKDCWKDSNMSLSYLWSSEGHSYHPEILLEVKIPILKKVFVDTFGYDEIVIIGAYRRYHDWVVSTYGEDTRQKCLHKYDEPCRTLWEFTKDTALSKNQNFYRSRYYKNLDETILPLINSSKDESSLLLLPKAEVTNTDTSAAMMIPALADSNIEDSAAAESLSSSSSPIKYDILLFFHMLHNKLEDGRDSNNKIYYYSSILTELYCKSLGMDRTPNTCRYSLERDGNGGGGGSNDSSSSSNGQKNGDTNNRRLASGGSKHHVSNTDQIPYHSIYVEAIRRGWIDPETQVTYRTHKPNYLSRIIEVDELEQYHTQELGLNWKENLPLLCPSYNRSKNGTTTKIADYDDGELLQFMLDKSLRFEELILPGFTDQNEKEKHIRSFWESVIDKKGFCWLDIKRLFENAASWNDLVKNRMIIDKWP